MVLKKKVKTEKSTGLKLGKTSKAKVKKQKDSQRQAKNSFFKAGQGRSRVWLLPPVCDEMDGVPLVETLMHSNLGPEKDGFGHCMRHSLEEPRENCLACVAAAELWDKVRKFKNEGKKQLEEKYVKIASQMSVRKTPLGQILDVTGAYNDKGKVVDKFPTCFGENLRAEENKYDKCRKCPFLESCRKGVQNWNPPKGAYDTIMKQISDKNIDITDPNKARPLLLKRVGTGLTTKYTCEKISNPLVIPAHVIKFVEDNATDLTKVQVPMTEEEMTKKMAGQSKKGKSKEGEIEHKHKGEKKSKKPNAKNFEKPKVSEKQKKEMFDKLKKQSDAKKAKKK